MGLMDNLMPASKGAIMRKGAAVAGGTGPVRMKKAPNLLQSIMGVFIGILLILAAPIAMWSAQSQDRAKDFKSATPVEATSGASGYVTFSGTPSYANADGGSDCIDGDCVYQKESQQELVTKQDLVCGNNVQNTDTQRILYQDGSECDENGDCVPCYQVEKDTWEEQNAVHTLHDVTIGSYTVTTSQGAIYLDTSSKTVETGFSDTGNEMRSVYTYFNMPSTLLVAGNSDGSTVRAGEKVFVFSAFDAETTLSKLKAMDRASQFLLWIVTFFMIFIGLSLIFGPLAWAGRFLRFVPVVGPLLSKGSGTLIAIASFLLAIPIWILIFVLVVLIKVWWLALILLIVLGALTFWLVKKKAAQSGGGGASAAPPAAAA